MQGAPRAGKKSSESTEAATTEAVTDGAGPDEAADEDEGARERERAAIKEREREVQRALATTLRDRDKEREHHKRDEAGTHFTALLADLVRDPELSWREAKKQLKKDHRYTLAQLLSKDDKERLFSQHTAALASKRRDKLFALLTSLGVGPHSSWRDARDKLSAATLPVPAYSAPHHMERDYREFQRSAGAAARAAFRQALHESRALTNRNVRGLDAAQAIKLLTESVSSDARYTALEHAAGERDAMIRAHIDELLKKGPPPPPTATEPARRGKAASAV